MDDRLLNIFLLAFIGGGLIFVFVKLIKDYKREVKKQKELAANIKDGPEVVYDTVEMRATVIEQICWVRTVGIKNPKTIREFTVAFKTDNGEILKFNVPEEMYDGFEKGQRGVITVIDGELYGFDLKEKKM